jgi:hypothetical protein
MNVFGVHHEVKYATNDGVYGEEEDRRSPTHAPGFSLISTALIIRAGGKLLCQLFLSFKWFEWSWLGGFWRVEGLDRKNRGQGCGVRGEGRTGNGESQYGDSGYARMTSQVR